MQERRRLKERFPSLALTEADAEICRSTLRNYETLAMAREVCEGKCVMGRTCPSGLCRQVSKRWYTENNIQLPIYHDGNISSKAFTCLIICYVCYLQSYRSPRRKLSTSSLGSVSSGRTPPQTPRMLPSAPPSPALQRSASVVSATRWRSGPIGLHSYTGGSAPPSR